MGVVFTAYAVLLATGMGTILQGSRMLIRGARSRREYAVMHMVLCNGCVTTAAACWQILYLSDWADGYLSQDLADGMFMLLVILAVLAPGLTGLFAAWRWNNRPTATALDYDDPANGNAVAAEPVRGRRRPPGAA